MKTKFQWLNPNVLVHKKYYSKPAVYYTEKILSVYSNITGKSYQTIEECDRDAIRYIRNQKLKKLNELQS